MWILILNYKDIFYFKHNGYIFICSMTKESFVDFEDDLVAISLHLTYESDKNVNTESNSELSVDENFFRIKKGI